MRTIEKLKRDYKATLHLKKAKDDSGADMVSVNVIVGDEAITLTVENTGYKNSEDIPMMGNQEGEKG